MDIVWDPSEIEARSMEIIESFLAETDLAPLEKMVARRIIHTTGDPDIVKVLRFSPGAVEAGIKALQAGAFVYTDVNMLRTGINGNKLAGYGGQAFCSIADPDVVQAAQAWRITRAAAAMRLYGRQLDRAVIAVGNAPTALFEVLDLVKKEICIPALIVGTPVGFVGAAESKDLLVRQDQVPYISVQGTRGGSPIAVSVINAMLYHEEGGRLYRRDQT
ncbi:MAG: precorrin-8X methylmutase [Syntrophomonadaceae bacterium]